LIERGRKMRLRDWWDCLRLWVCGLCLWFVWLAQLFLLY